MDITDLPAHALSDAIRARNLSCRDVMQATLARIEAVNPAVNAIVSLRDGDALLREADQHDARLASGTVPTGWLYGIPQAIKDTVPTAGLRTTRGSPLLRDFVPTQDGLVVERMKAAGCIVIGKTNVPEFGLGSHTFNEVFGTTRNAFDRSKSAGGSSGGAAVAVATRMLAVADGSDFMGSLRNPAAWNNLFALRPSQGRVPMWPAEDVWVTQLVTEGPMGRTVRDVALLLDVQSGYDARVPLSLPTERCADTLDAFDARGARIGWLGDLSGYLPFEPGILEACEQGLGRLQGCGCSVESILPGFDPAGVWQTWLVWRRWMVGARLAPYLVDPRNREQIKPEALWEYDQAQQLTGAETWRASAQRTAYYQKVLALFDRCDYLALPATQVWPFDATERWPRMIAGRAMDTYHRWMEVVIYATLAGLPSISVPVGFGPTGLPAGMQLIGRPRADLAVLQLARAYEQLAQDVVAVRPAL
jgi:amidase